MHFKRALKSFTSFTKNFRIGLSIICILHHLMFNYLRTTKSYSFKKIPKWWTYCCFFSFPSSFPTPLKFDLKKVDWTKICYFFFSVLFIKCIVKLIYFHYFEIIILKNAMIKSLSKIFANFCLTNRENCLWKRFH